MSLTSARPFDERHPPTSILRSHVDARKTGHRKRGDQGTVRENADFRAIDALIASIREDPRRVSREDNPFRDVQRTRSVSPSPPKGRSALRKSPVDGDKRSPLTGHNKSYSRQRADAVDADVKMNIPAGKTFEGAGANANANVNANYPLKLDIRPNDSPQSQAAATALRAEMSPTALVRFKLEEAGPLSPTAIGAWKSFSAVEDEIKRIREASQGSIPNEFTFGFWY
eukprot:3591877-Rhodomonas_salina.1